MRTLNEPENQRAFEHFKSGFEQRFIAVPGICQFFGRYRRGETAVEGLNSAAGYVRRELGQRIKLRRSPQIQFVADDSIEHSAHINQMLHDLNKG